MTVSTDLFEIEYECGCVISLFPAWGGGFEINTFDPCYEHGEEIEKRYESSR